jgi:DNA primase
MNNNPFEQIRDKLNILEVVSQYIETKPNGQNYKACCPFHNEKSPSLIISPTKNIWHCFGCGLGGDIFKFVSLYENTDKAGALRILALKAGITLEQKKLTPVEKENKKQIEDKYVRGQKLLHWSANIYHQVLLKILEQNNNSVTEYCRSRDWKMTTIQKFSIGYAPSGNFLFEIAKKHNIDQDLLIEVGLIKENRQDKFSDRIMIPIMDKTNQVIGFTGRILNTENNEHRPKYLNSSQSVWFNKSSIWYGQNWHSNQIRQQKKAILVEGNMDVIMSSQMGFDFALASQGTSFTIEQLKQLKFLTNTIWLAFDNDNAGQIASQKLFVQAKLLGFEVYKVIIPKEYKDLDEYLQKDKPKELRTIIFLEYYISQNIHQLESQDTQEQKQTIIKILELLSVCDKITQEQFLNKISERTGISVSTLNSLITKNTQKVEFVEIDTKKNVEVENIILSSLQSLINQQNIENEEIIFTFEILQKIIPTLQDYSSPKNYYLENKNEIELIQESQISETESYEFCWQKIMNFVDHNLNKFIFDTTLANHYLHLKKIDKTNHL